MSLLQTPNSRLLVGYTLSLPELNLDELPRPEPDHRLKDPAKIAASEQERWLKQLSLLGETPHFAQLGSWAAVWVDQVDLGQTRFRTSTTVDGLEDLVRLMSLVCAGDRWRLAAWNPRRFLRVLLAQAAAAELPLEVDLWSEFNRLVDLESICSPSLPGVDLSPLILRKLHVNLSPFGQDAWLDLSRIATILSRFGEVDQRTIQAAMELRHTSSARA